MSQATAVSLPAQSKCQLQRKAVGRQTLVTPRRLQRADRKQALVNAASAAARAPAEEAQLVSCTYQIAVVANLVSLGVADMACRHHTRTAQDHWGCRS